MWNLRQVLTTSLAGVVLSVLLSGCSYDGGDLGNPIDRRFEWFSFVGGDDIRTACVPGAPDRYRLIYTALYDEQVRVYEVDSASRVLTEQVLRPANLARFNLDDIASLWEPVTAKVPLSTDDYKALQNSLNVSGVYAPPPVGLDLPSHSYNWTAAFCHQGQYGFTGWLYPSPAFDKLTFNRWLFDHDKTGIAIDNPAPIPFDALYNAQVRDGQAFQFIITVGSDGPVRSLF